jgi:hypothetical protein
MKGKKVLLTLCFFVLGILPLFAQLEQQLVEWTAQAKIIAQLVIGLAAVGGGLYAYFKVQTDDGGTGKKAIGNFVLALIFGAVLIAVIEFFLGA